MKNTDEKNLKNVRVYLIKGERFMPYRRFKKSLKKLIEDDNPEGLTIASSMQFNLNDEEFEKKRIALLNRAIDLNFTPAMFTLGEIYFEKRQFEKAFQLYERASESLYAYALKEMSIAYRRGLHGFKKDSHKADELLEKAKNGIYWDEFEGFSKHDSSLD